MFGAICGDVVGSIYESWIMSVDSKDFPLFTSAHRYTDDTVLTVAIADAILTRTPYELKIQEWYKKYPNNCYGGRFVEWAESFDPANPHKNDSYSNGAMMRVSPIGYAFNDLDVVLAEAELSCEYTHNSDEARRGAKAIAAAVFMARKGRSKPEIRSYIERMSGYDLSPTIQTVRDKFDKKTIRCDVTGPQALIAFLEGRDYEDTVRSAIYSLGDCDTIAAISGGIAYPYYKMIPIDIRLFVMNRLPDDMKNVIHKFHKKFD